MVEARVLLVEAIEHIFIILKSRVHKNEKRVHVSNCTILAHKINALFVTPVYMFSTALCNVPIKTMLDDLKT